MTPDEMEACAELIEMALGAYLIAHPRATGPEVTALDLAHWVKATADNAKRNAN